MPTEHSHQSRAAWAAATPEERTAEVARDERLAIRDIRRAFLLTLLSCVFWLTTSLLLMGWGVHTTDAVYGRIAFLAGMTLGYAGIAGTLAWYYLKRQESGWR